MPKAPSKKHSTSTSGQPAPTRKGKDSKPKRSNKGAKQPPPKLSDDDIKAAEFYESKTRSSWCLPTPYPPLYDVPDYEGCRSALSFQFKKENGIRLSKQRDGEFRPDELKGCYDVFPKPGQPQNVRIQLKWKAYPETAYSIEIPGPMTVGNVATAVVVAVYDFVEYKARQYQCADPDYSFGPEGKIRASQLVIENLITWNGIDYFIEMKVLNSASSSALVQKVVADACQKAREHVDELRRQIASPNDEAPTIEEAQPSAARTRRRGRKAKNVASGSAAESSASSMGPAQPPHTASTPTPSPGPSTVSSAQSLPLPPTPEYYFQQYNAPMLPKEPAPTQFGVYGPPVETPFASFPLPPLDYPSQLETTAEELQRVGGDFYALANENKGDPSLFPDLYLSIPGFFDQNEFAAPQAAPAMPNRMMYGAWGLDEAGGSNANLGAECTGYGQVWDQATLWQQ